MTEASPLTYPEDTSFDELNTVLSRKGNRQRRFGINYSDANTTARSYDNSKAKAEYVWSSVASRPELTFLVVQNANVISFYDRSVPAFAASLKPFTIDLSAYVRPGLSAVTDVNCKFASGKGFLFIVNPDMEPLVVSYDKATDTINVTKIVILGRDFQGLPDGLANDAEPTTLSIAHFYNLLNQGWVSK